MEDKKRVFNENCYKFHTKKIKEDDNTFNKDRV
jgi:hypothetical protein